MQKSSDIDCSRHHITCLVLYHTEGAEGVNHRHHAAFTTLSSSNSMSTIPSLVTALTTMPLKSIGSLRFSSSVHILRILMPWPRVISGWWCLSRMERQ